MNNSDLINVIKRDIPIPELAEKLGYHIVRHGRNKYTTKEHDSLIIKSDGRLFTWNSRNISGSVIDFYMAVMSVDLNEAISSLRMMLNLPEFVPKPNYTMPEKKEVIFEPNKVSTEKWSRLYAYLFDRGISKEVVNYAVKEKYIYQDKRNNLCFAGKDYDGELKYLSFKSTATGNKFKNIAEGGDYDLRFLVNLTQRNENIKDLFICEAGVDVLSIMSLLQMNGKDFTKYAYLSLDGTDVASVKTHIEKNPQINRVFLSQDNDEGGHKSAQATLSALKEAGFKGVVINNIPKEPGFDYNDKLKKEIKEIKEIELCQDL